MCVCVCKGGVNWMSGLVVVKDGFLLGSKCVSTFYQAVWVFTWFLIKVPLLSTGST